jgi:hypothetical protein
VSNNQVNWAAPVWDRFAHWPRGRARLLLAVFAALVLLAVLVPVEASKGGVASVPSLVGGNGAERPRDDDLALYDHVIERIRGGEHYYDFIVEEQRRADYPVRPGLAVRLPTLAYLDAWLGLPGQIAAAFVLLAALLLAWWRRLTDEPGGLDRRALGVALVLMGGSLGLNRYYFVLHELWAGMLLALAFALHRPGRKWGWALAVAALALAIREHCLPFVLLMAAMAFWRREWKQGAAWSALAVAFVAALAIHLQIVAGDVLPSDRPSPPWLALRGLSGWLSNIVLASNLRFLPHFVAGPLLLLMVLGWAGWRSPAGAFATLLYLGYGLLFMIAGRKDNFYWGAVVAPAMFVGLAFAPMALKSLWRSATANVGARTA